MLTLENLENTKLYNSKIISRPRGHVNITFSYRLSLGACTVTTYISIKTEIILYSQYISCLLCQYFIFNILLLTVLENTFNTGYLRYVP